MNHRYDFIYLYDCLDANPNGDPDSGNLPRVDSETGQGIVTDVCLKRKVRNFIQMTHPDNALEGEAPNERAFDIYVKEKAVLNLQHQRAYAATKLESEKKKLPKKLEDAKKVTDWMCRNFFDIRTFGAVMTTEVNCGQVRGPVQLAFSRSIDPVVAAEHAITRMAVATVGEAEKQQGDNRTMGRKFTIPYALYRTHGTVNPFLGKQTGFTEDGDQSDLDIFFNALENAFEFDASAARPAGSMGARGLLVFKHQKALGNAHSHELFDRLKIESFSESPSDDGRPARSFVDYKPRVTFDGVQIDEFVKAGEKKDLENGVTLIRRI